MEGVIAAIPLKLVLQLFDIRGGGSCLRLREKGRAEMDPPAETGQHFRQGGGSLP